MRRQHWLFGRHGFTGQLRQHLGEVWTRLLAHHRLMIKLDR
jgi:hypothetical protein